MAHSLSNRLDPPRLARAATLLIALIIAYLSLKPPAPPGAEGPPLLSWIAQLVLKDASQADKIGHTLAYAALGAAGMVGFATRVAWPVIAFIGFAYGAAFEGLQSWMPERTASYADMMANGLGIIGGITLGWLGGLRWKEGS